jgi:hypothetical protein
MGTLARLPLAFGEDEVGGGGVGGGGGQSEKGISNRHA